jgi:hypothetical protein
LSRIVTSRERGPSFGVYYKASCAVQIRCEGHDTTRRRKSKYYFTGGPESVPENPSYRI